MPLGGECYAWERWLLLYGGWLSTGILLGCSFSSLPRAINPRFSSSVSYPAFPLWEPRVRSCKQNVVCWPFKILSVSPAISPWWTETPLIFTAGCYLGPFQLWWCRPVSPAWGLDSTLLWGNPGSLKYLRHFSCCLWSPASLLTPPQHSLPVPL